MRKMKQRKKSKNRTGKICISCMVVVLTLIMSVQIGHLYQVNEGYKQDEKTKQAQLKDEQGAFRGASGKGSICWV